MHFMNETCLKAIKTRWFSLSIIGIGLVALAIRIGFPLGSSLSFDEIFSVRLAQYPWHELWSLSRFETNPILFYVLLSGWIKLVGTSEVMLRMLSVIMSLVALFGLWAFTKELAGKRASIYGALIFALSPFFLYFSREARMYPFMLAAGMWGFYFFFKYVRERKIKQLIAYLALMMIAGMFHLSFLVVFAIHIVVVACIRAIRPMSVWPWILVHIPSLAVCGFFIMRTLIARAPYAGSLTSHWLFHSPGKAYFFPTIIQTGLLSGAGFFGAFDIFILLFMAVCLLWYFFRVSTAEKGFSATYDVSDHARRWWLALVCFLPLVAGYVVGIKNEKFFVVPLACVIILFAIGISRIQFRYLQAVMVVFIAAVCFMTLPSVVQMSKGINWPNLVRYVNAQTNSNDRVIIHLFHEKISFDYYDSQHKADVKGFFPNKETQSFKDVMISNPYPIVTEENVGYLEQLTKGYDRVWLVDTMGYGMDYWNGSLVRDWFTSHGWNVVQKKFFGIYSTGAVFEYERLK